MLYLRQQQHLILLLIEEQKSKDIHVNCNVAIAIDDLQIRGKAISCEHPMNIHNKDIVILSKDKHPELLG